ncbi:MAG: lysophospholipid acyltransferase family protein [Rhodospirillales bacterium]|nr:lysophospholipid acyltransferase family protein [Alphaproteobacteria bacterium]MCB9986010.1 lysophospholipid acyltransferase family protein [Rhodospirillales bacterium]USO07415.1 MAG: lysophospholipid acyltransferase family protein [Rhodospirillales bacterium]
MRHVLEYALLRGFLGVCAVLPVDAASGMGAVILGAIGPRMGISRTARANIERAFPEWTPAQVKACVGGIWRHFGRVIAEYPHLETIARSRVTYLNLEVFEALRGRTVLFVSGHIGNWEVMPPALLLGQGITMHSAYRAPNNPLVDRLIVRLRGFGGRLKSFGKHRKGLAEILRALEGGESVGMLIDQKMNTGIEVPFFGRPAMTSTAFVELARKTGCPLVPGHIARTKGCHFVFSLEPPIAVAGRETETVVREMHGFLERWIRATPEQWLWMHRRWKS